MDQLNDMSVVEQQYATATNLQTICKRELPFMINIRQTRWDSETGFFPIIKLPPECAFWN